MIFFLHGSAEMQAKRRLWLLLPRKKCQLAPLIVYNRQFGGMTTTEWLKPPIGTQVSHNDTAAINSFFHSQSATLSFPDPLCTCWLIWPCATRLFPVSPFHPHGGVPTSSLSVYLLRTHQVESSLQLDITMECYSYRKVLW